MSLTGFDVEHPLRIAALDASTGRIARLRGSPREGPESAPEPSFDCEREIAFSARHARDRHNDARLRRNRRQRSSANSRHALVDVGTLDLIERTACAVVQLRKAMLSLTPEYRWIPTSMTNAEFADVYRCVYEDQRWFEQNYGDQDLGERVTVTRESPGINDCDARSVGNSPSQCAGHRAQQERAREREKEECAHVVLLDHMFA
jgi:hypothetical protein